MEAKIARGAPFISHLLFTDDSLLFCKAIFIEVRVVRDILEDYNFMSRQLINFDKPASYFSKDTCCLWYKELTRIIGVPLMNDDERYLDNPLFIRKESSTFQSLVSKAKFRIITWQIPLLSQVGRSTLIK